MKTKQKRIHSVMIPALLLSIACMLSALAPTAFADGEPAFRYEHDPRLNPKAMADVVADPSAVYGFAPSPDGSLSINEMYAMMNAMRIEGKSVEEIARAVSSKRNEIRLAAYAENPEGLAAAKARNLERYGHEEGPLPDELYAQYGSWETVLEKAFGVNSGMDACLGLYDDYYELYIMAGQIEDERTAPASREMAVAAFVDATGIALPDGTDALSAFTDGDEVSAYYAAELSAAVQNGILKGYGDRTLRPQDTISRVEALVILSRYLPDLEAGDAVAFTDVPLWAKNDIDRLSGAGLVRGYGDGTLGAADNLTVEQVKMLTAQIVQRRSAAAGR